MPADQTVVVHDPADPDPTPAFALSRLDDPSMQTVPMGIFRQVERPTYDDSVREQVAAASADAPAAGAEAEARLDVLLRGRDTWTVDGTRPGEVEQTLEGETTEGPIPAAGEALVEEGDEAFEE